MEWGDGIFWVYAHHWLGVSWLSVHSAVALSHVPLGWTRAQNVTWTSEDVMTPQPVYVTPDML